MCVEAKDARLTGRTDALESEEKLEGTRSILLLYMHDQMYLMASSPI